MYNESAPRTSEPTEVKVPELESDAAETPPVALKEAMVTAVAVNGPVDSAGAVMAADELIPAPVMEPDARNESRHRPQ